MMADGENMLCLKHKFTYQYLKLYLKKHNKNTKKFKTPFSEKLLKYENLLIFYEYEI